MGKEASGLGSFLVLLVSRHMAADFTPPPTPPRSHLGPKGRRRAPSGVMWPGLPHSSGAPCALQSLAWPTLGAS